MRRADAAIVTAMRGGSSMSVEAIDLRGRPFADTYRLRGGGDGDRCRGAGMCAGGGRLLPRSWQNPGLGTMCAVMNALMQIPGGTDPVPVPRAITPREDGADRSARAHQGSTARGRSPRPGSIRSRPNCAPSSSGTGFYNRGTTDFTLMTDIAKAMHPWLVARFRRRAARSDRGAGFDRRHAQVAAPLGRRAGL